MRNLHLLTYTLIILGALNWGLVGFFGLDLVSLLFGYMSAFSRIIYAIIGLSAIVEIILNTQGYKFVKTYAH